MSNKIQILFLSAILLQVALAGWKFNSPTPTGDQGKGGLHTTADHYGQEDFYRHEFTHIPQTLDVAVTYDSETELTIRIADKDKKPRFEMSHEYPHSHTKVKVQNPENIQYNVDIKEDGFILKRKSTGETLFDITGKRFIVSELYTTFTTTIPSKYLYGFGERNKNFLFTSGQYTLWAKDQFAVIDDGVNGNKQTYGYHPVYMMRETSGNWHVVYLRTTNAMDVWFDANAKTLRYETNSEFIELKVFLGDKYPDTAIKQYHRYINGYAMVPFWSLGYHQCRWGYLFMQEFNEVYNNMTQHDLPLDVVWSDIDYMNNFTDFTVDEDRYNVAEFRKLTEKVHWVPIIDSGVFMNDSTPGIKVGNEMNVWIRSALNNSNPLIGIVWPGLVHWPDWLHPNATSYWSQMLKLVHDIVPYSGLWLDMDENSNFCTGEFNKNCFVLPNYLPDGPLNHVDPKKDKIDPIPLTNVPQPPIHPGTPVDPKIVEFNSGKLPYLPGNVALEASTISINALHHDGVLEFDFHNLNSFYECKISHEALAKMTKKRPFILTRSSTVGSGQFTTHWTGDNFASWDHLRLSIPGIFNFQLFGIPMTGADICGFGGDTTVELCARWMQLGAFYPFMRNHNKIDSKDQEPYALGPVVMSASRASLKLRYSILKFYYSLFVRNNGAGSIFRPMFFDFPEDEAIHDLQTQFLVGSELLVVPVVDEGATHGYVHFPANTKWYNFFDGSVVNDQNKPANHNYAHAPLDGTLSVYLREGKIVHRQNVDKVLNTKDLNNHFNLIVGLHQASANTYTAAGQMMGITNYNDDSSVDNCLDKHDCLVNIGVNAVVQSDSTVKVTVSFDKNAPHSTLQENLIDSITLYGVRTKICEPTDNSCADQDHVVTCKTDRPLTVQYGKVSFTLAGDKCTPSTQTISI